MPKNKRARDPIDVALTPAVIAEAKAKAAFLHSLASTNTTVRELLIPAASPSDRADGPFEPFGFQFQGKPVDLSAAPLRYRLASALWNGAAGRPHESRDGEQVMDELWPDDPESEDKLKDLCRHLRREFEAGGLALEVRQSGGKVWLEIRPD
jgi:hypothetical protein